MITKFSKVRWKNFLSTGSAFTEVVLDKNENTLIVGENGAGKSTILDALCYCLFGKPFRNINLPTLINSINGSALLTECEFSIGTNSYLVRRGMKPNIFEIYKDGKLVDQTASIDYQSYLETYILRWNKKTFIQVVVLGNANFTPFMQLKAADRRDIIDDILDVQIFSTMRKLLSSRIDKLESNISNNKHEYELTDKEVRIKVDHIDDLKRMKDGEIQAIDDEILDLKIKIVDIMKFINIAEAKVRLNTTGLAKFNKEQLTSKLKKAEEYRIQISQKYLKANSDISFWQNTDKCPTCEEPISSEKATHKSEKCKAKIVELESAREKLSSMIEKFDSDLSFIKTYSDNIKEQENKIQQYRNEIVYLEASIKSAEAKKKTLESFKDELNSESGELSELQERLVELADSREEFLKTLAHYEVAEQFLKDNGIKARIIKQYLPVINKLVNKYLAEQDFFVNFELDESFKEVIKSRYRDEFSYENFSEGEKQKIDMSLMLTWREVAKLKNSASTNILILDEIFDSSLDSQGVEYLMKLLHSLEKCNLFVISHKGDILQDKFKSVVKFHKIGNYSVIA
jgi:DNA repair exonuclease SbcCD ATPase subunit